MADTNANAHLSTVQLQALRQDIEEQLERRSRHLLGLRAEAQDSTGADDTWQELLVSLTTADRAIAELTQALDRLAAGTYGRCGECGAGIPFERLKIRPLARYCIGCQRRAETA
ncbi:C4-type zinc finger protein, DksA/TraR family [[Actinomadura] parvosata subsp. kistnae]|uniref:TraR/DksA family transcriptional regulator n=1 Tax=[Actinomadura] parvosata subsp. kistnae TaxID=1909395 RepID=A0A1V0AJ32_9ACTN|nr:TraR/DksA family transcriptional regulator [Nonomuraea sp. ATCC 55076]AQZ70205.1 TraR/DksA family transcriptional regulator [Nonomuraea sp. ATCC 55076]SPL97995.1 C4-type zinc finger protein, DksA/TraR family [Actinomadura parvosata subsp. kistnae]